MGEFKPGDSVVGIGIMAGVEGVVVDPDMSLGPPGAVWIRHWINDKQRVRFWDNADHAGRSWQHGEHFDPRTLSESIDGTFSTPNPGFTSGEEIRDIIRTHAPKAAGSVPKAVADSDTPKPGEWWAFDMSPDHSGDWQPRQIPESGGFPKCNRRRVYPDAFWGGVTDRMQAEIADRAETIATIRRLCAGERAAFLDGMGTMAIATGDEFEEARRAWAKANAECCELKARAERAEAANAIHMKACERMEAELTKPPEGCHVPGCDGEAMVWLGCCYGHNVDRVELAESNRRIAAALEHVEKWGETCKGWAAILRGEDG